jgi:putative flippase GtrA
MNALLQFIQFGIVGGGGMVIDFSATWLLKEKLRLNPYLANSIGFSLAVINNFFWNKYWTFHDNSEAVEIQFAKFLAISLIGLLLNNGAVYLLHKRFGMRFYVAKLCATGLVLMWNFGANYRFTFHPN